MKYLLVCPNSDYGKLMWQDLNSITNVEIIEKPLLTNIRMINLFYRIHFSFKLNNKINLPFKKIWNNQYQLNHFNYKEDEKYIIVFTDPALCNYRKDFLEKLKKKGCIKYVLLIINSFYRMRKIIEPMLEIFDKIYSYDKDEAIRFGFEYYPTVYSFINIKLEERTETDCFFVGVAKDRLDKLIKIYDKLKSIGIRGEFYISGVKKNHFVHRDGIIYNKWLSYETVLKKIKNTKCIIEIMDKNNAGITLRTLEAICYNKKLITNNEKIKENPFYNSNYICLVNNELNIPQGFIEDVDTVNYGYDGRYSPVIFFEMLDEEFDGFNSSGESG